VKGVPVQQGKRLAHGGAQEDLDLGMRKQNGNKEGDLEILSLIGSGRNRRHDKDGKGAGKKAGGGRASREFRSKY